MNSCLAILESDLSFFKSTRPSFIQSESALKIEFFYNLSSAGGFGGNIGHDPHLLYTLSAVQVLALFGKLDVLDVEKVANCILPMLIFMNKRSI